MFDDQLELELEIKTYDIDMAGHVNNTVYVRWIEDLRSRLLGARHSINDLRERNLYPVVTATEIRYRNQLKFGDKPKGLIRIESVSHGLMHLKVVFQKEEVVIATAEQDCVIMDLQTGRMDKKAMEVYS